MFHTYGLLFNNSWVDFGNESEFKIATKTWGFWIKNMWPATGSGYYLGDSSTHYGLAHSTQRLRFVWKNTAGAGKNLYGPAAGSMWHNQIAALTDVS